MCRCSQHPGGQSWAPDPLGAGDWVSSRIPAHEVPPANELETAGANKQDTLPGPSPSGFSGLGSPPLPSAPSSTVPLLLKNKSVPAVAAQTADVRELFSMQALHWRPSAPSTTFSSPRVSAGLAHGYPRGQTFLSESVFSFSTAQCLLQLAKFPQGGLRSRRAWIFPGRGMKQAQGVRPIQVAGLREFQCVPDKSIRQ